MIICPVCNSLNIFKIVSSKDFELFKCKSCSVLFKVNNIQSEEYYNEIFSVDPSAETTPREIFYQIINKIIIDKCCLQKSSYILVLDVVKEIL
jgi:hypothetical protein